jgi:hypothetical protein
MGTLWMRWAARLATREAATSLALWRIVVGLVVLYMVGMGLLSDDMRVLWLDANDGGVRSLAPRQWLLGLLGGPTPTTWGILVTSATLGALGLLFGLMSRLSALVALQALIALFAIHPATGGGHDKLITNALYLLCLSPAGHTLSLDCRFRTGSWRDDSPVGAWIRYLAVGQLALMYTATGWQKLGSEWFPWGDYEAVYRSLLLPSWARFNLVGVAWFYPLTQVGTAVTWIWESTFFLVPLTLYARATRTRPGRWRAIANRLDLRSLYAAIGLSMHLILFVLLELGPFSLISASFYICLYSPAEWQRILGHWLPRPNQGSNRNTVPEPKSAT